MKMNLKFRTVAILIAIFLLTSCNQNPKSTTKDQKNVENVKVGYLHMVSSLTHFVAVEKGFYKEQGLNVEAVEIKTSDLIAQELAAGHVNIGVELAITPLLKQNEISNNSIKIFSTSNITTANGFDGILVKSDSKINSFDKLSGKRIGGFPGSTAKVSLLNLFSRLYPKLSPPIFMELDPNVHIQSLENNEIDALFAYEPVLSTGIVKFKFKKIYPSIYGSQFTPNPIGVAGVNTSWYNSNIETAAKYFTAMDKAIDFINSNPDESRIILAKATNIEIEIAKNMNILPLSKTKKIDMVNLDKYINVLIDLKEISIPVKAVDICIHQ